MTSRARAGGSLCVAAMLAASIAEVVPAQVQKPTVFKSGVELVAVDVNVVDRSGQPVSQLRADQFEVTLDGKARRVVSADLVEVAPGGASSPVSPGKPPAAARQGYSDNAEERSTSSPGRLIILAVDQGSFRPAGAMAAIAATRRFLDQLQPWDRVGLVAFPPPGPEVAPTRNHAAIRMALEKVIGSAEPGTSLAGPSRFNISVSEALDLADRDAGQFQIVASRECANVRTALETQACRAEVQMTADAIASVVAMRSQKSVQGIGDVMAVTSGIREHKALILISAGLVTSDRPGSRAAFTEDMAVIGRLAAAANTNIYALHFDSSFLDSYSPESRSMSQTLFRDSSIAAMGLEAIAGGSGGSVFRVVTGPESAFGRILRETSAYYVLGVEPEEADRDGKAHRIKVAVKLPGVAVRGRTEVVLPRSSTEPVTPERAVVDALAAPRLSTALPVRLTTSTTARLDGDTYQVLLSADIGEGLSGKVDIRVGYVVTDSMGRPSKPVFETRQAWSRASGPAGSVSCLVGLAMTAGTYLVRMAAADPAGRVGSVEHRFEVRLTEAPGVAIGELLLADAARGPDDPIAPVSDGRIRGNAVAAYVEALPAAGSAITGITFGVADSPDGPPLLTAPGKLTRRNKSIATAAESRLDLSLLPPGDYFAVAIVADRSKRVTRVSRPFSVERPAVPINPSGPSAPLAIGASGGLLRPFSRVDVLSPEVLEFFLGRMRSLDGTPASGSVTAAIEDARNGRYDAMLSDLASAESEQLSVAFLRGIALFSKGELNAAADQFRTSLRVSSDFLPAAFYLGSCFAAAGKDEEAVGAWQTSLVTESEVRIIYEMIADARMRLRDAAAAIEILGEARDRWPDDDAFLPRLGVALATADRRDVAMKTLGQFLDRHPEADEVLFLAMRLIYEARSAGGAMLSAGEDKDLMTRYAGLYRAAGGSNLQLVERWARFVR